MHIERASEKPVETMHSPSSDKRSTTISSLSLLLLSSFLSLLFILLSLSISNPISHTFPPTLSSSVSSPSLAYFLYGSSNSSRSLLRLLSSVYHPNNHYLLCLSSSSRSQREALLREVRKDKVYEAVGNVEVVGKVGWSYEEGVTGLSEVLRGAAILLRMSKWDWFVSLSVYDYPLITQDVVGCIGSKPLSTLRMRKWDWFVPLSANEYPLVAQDDLLHILSYMPKDLNFVNHTSYIGWRESRSLKRIVVDPGLYLSEKSWMFYATQKRNLPDAFQLFTGSYPAILSREAIEYSILGTDNFPRTLLMYLSNTPWSSSVYFPTLLCNSPHFNRTIINHSLHYSSFDADNRPLPLNSSDFESMIKSGSPFASPFFADDAVLDQIDKEILKRSPGKPVPGGWCLGEPDNDTCSVLGDAGILRPGPGSKRLEKFVVDLLSNGTFRSHQCVVG